MIETTAPSIAPKTGLSKAEISFIIEHLHDNVSDLMLHASRFKSLDIRKVAGQIQSRQKALKKLPEWSSNPRLIFPPALSVEQSSSEATARYKASLISGDELIDITGGMGVDCYYMHYRFYKTTYFEEQPEVAEAAQYNFAQLKVIGVDVNAANSIEALEKQPLSADWIYADPARRNANRDKVVLLSDCTPDVVAHLPVLFESAQNILLKTSPLLDIDLAARSLRNLKEVHVVGYEGECKELLFVLKKDWTPDDFEIKVRLIDGLGNIVNQLDFSREEERASEARYEMPLKFLYEPHAAVLKAGAFKTICNTYLVSKLAVNSQLYTSEHLKTDFPGRAFEIIAVCKPDARAIAKYMTGDKANITVRNFPAKSEELRKKWKLKDGGKYYLFATTLTDNSKMVIITVKPEF